MAGALLGVALGAAGCHSAYIEATVVNASGAAVSLVEMDYPSASFGRQTLADTGVYTYRFKVLGNGATKLLWTDAAHREHTSAGPVLHEGDEGRVTITIGASAANWHLELKKK